MMLFYQVMNIKICKFIFYMIIIIDLIRNETLLRDYPDHHFVAGGSTQNTMRAATVIIIFLLIYLLNIKHLFSSGYFNNLVLVFIWVVSVKINIINYYMIQLQKQVLHYVIKFIMILKDMYTLVLVLY